MRAISTINEAVKLLDGGRDRVKGERGAVNKGNKKRRKNTCILQRHSRNENKEKENRHGRQIIQTKRLKIQHLL